MRSLAARALPAAQGAPSPTQTGRRVLFASAPAPAHDKPGHPECAARGAAVDAALAASGLVEAGRVHPATFDAVSLDELAAAGVHDAGYVAGLAAECGRLGAAATVIESSPTYATATTFNDAARAVGAAYALVDAAFAAGDASSPPPVGFAAVRPPGHHAGRATPQGFCLLNTAALAVRRAQTVHGAARVAVFDFDVHHGNGTNDIFHDDPSVLFVSTHQEFSFPGTGKLTDVGSGDGEGATINLPLPADGGDGALRAAWEGVVAPALVRFAPDFMVVSSGYDAHWSDMLASMQALTRTYHWLGRDIVALADALCGGRVIFLLEGGYSPRHLGLNVVDSLRGVLGLPSADKYDAALLRDEPGDRVAAAVAEARRIHGL